MFRSYDAPLGRPALIGDEPRYCEAAARSLSGRPTRLTRRSIDGEDIYRRQQDVVELRKRVGMVFQRSNPFPKSIFDNVAYGPRVHGVRSKATLHEIVEQTLKQAALWEEVKDRLGESAMDLSGGQQHRPGPRHGA